MKRTSALLIPFLFGFISHSSVAATIAIVDSGTDLNHSELKSKAWVNASDPDDAVDNDDNGYIDDTNGWNFADNNNKLVDMKYQGTFSKEVFDFFEIQTRLLLGKGTESDKKWMNEKRGDEKYIQSLEKFGNWVHGTHVAGIAAKGADNARIMPLKIIPTEVPRPFKKSAEREMRARQEVGGLSDAVIHFGLNYLAKAQAQALAPVAKYMATEHAQVANCSFGVSTAAAKGILTSLLQIVLHRPPTDEELASYSKYFVDQVVEVQNKEFVARARKTLFVIAAGNDGTDNDQFPASPANIKSDNTITVAATRNRESLAAFSNFGAKMVDVAAPGVGIRSTIPGNEYVQLSGTSQATPYVTNVAGQILDANPKLSPVQVKRILMDTVDVKPFLVGKVSSNGMVNPERAIRAAILSTTQSVADAVVAARGQVNDVTELRELSVPGVTETYVLPLPTLFE